MALPGDDILLYDVQDSVATITLNRPERMNALSIELLDRLDDAWRRFEEDEGARVAILIGAGPQAFCAGGDLRDSSDGKVGSVPKARGIQTPYPRATFVWEVSKPVIGVINGYAVGGGFMLALNADIRIASESATFGITEAAIGRAAPWSIPLLWAMPSSVALEMLLAGTRLSAERAGELGVVNEVFDAAALPTRATEIAEVIASNAPLTVRAHKRLYHRAMDVGRATGYLIADELCREIYTSEDCQEGQRAFRERRPPVFTGK